MSYDGDFTIMSVQIWVKVDFIMPAFHCGRARQTDSFEYTILALNGVLFAANNYVVYNLAPLGVAVRHLSAHVI